jgi:hypothetical protein
MKLISQTYIIIPYHESFQMHLAVRDIAFNIASDRIFRPSCAVGATPEPPAAVASWDGGKGNVALVDASNYIFRFHHALKSSRLKSFDGTEDTSIQHLFLKFVIALCEGKYMGPFGKATYLVVVFDGVRSLEAINVRRQILPQYKVRTSQSRS